MGKLRFDVLGIAEMAVALPRANRSGHPSPIIQILEKMMVDRKEMRGIKPPFGKWLVSTDHG